MSFSELGSIMIKPVYGDHLSLGHYYNFLNVQDLPSQKTTFIHSLSGRIRRLNVTSLICHVDSSVDTLRIARDPWLSASTSFQCYVGCQYPDSDSPRIPHNQINTIDL